MDYPSIEKFSFKELFNNSKGQTDAHLFAGLLMVIVACVTFPYCIFAKLEIFANLTIGFATLGAGLLGVSRFTKDKELTILDNNTSTEVTGGPKEETQKDK